MLRKTGWICSSETTAMASAERPVDRHVQRAEVGHDGVDRDTTHVAGAGERVSLAVGRGVGRVRPSFRPDDTNRVAVPWSVMPPLSKTDWRRPLTSSTETTFRGLEGVAGDGRGTDRDGRAALGRRDLERRVVETDLTQYARPGTTAVEAPTSVKTNLSSTARSWVTVRCRSRPRCP
jgi:hypothetical protein